jgi:hypothetical protein
MLSPLSRPVTLLPPLEPLFAPPQVPGLLGVLERLTRIAMTPAGPPILSARRTIGPSLAAFFGRALRVFLRIP